MDIDTAELNKLIADLSAGSARVAAKASTVVRKAALDVEAEAKRLAPVDTGFLRNSIGSTITGDSGSVTAEIGPTADYGAYLEFGTRSMAPRAYMGPALDRITPSFVQALEQTAGEVL